MSEIFLRCSVQNVAAHSSIEPTRSQRLSMDFPILADSRAARRLREELPTICPEHMAGQVSARPAFRPSMINTAKAASAAALQSKADECRCNEVRKGCGLNGIGSQSTVMYLGGFLPFSQASKGIMISATAVTTTSSTPDSGGTLFKSVARFGAGSNGSSTAHCSQVRSNRPVTARGVHEVSGVRFSSSMKYLPETSPNVDLRHSPTASSQVRNHYRFRFRPK
jgi:hypothetical protein